MASDNYTVWLTVGWFSLKRNPKPIVLSFLLLVVVGSSVAPDVHGSSVITFDSTAHSHCSSCSILTWSHKVGSGSNRILIVGLSSGGGYAAKSVTYGSQPLTLIARQYSNEPEVEMWYLLSPAKGTATITATGPFLASEIGGSISYFDVASVGSFNSASGASSPASVKVNSHSGDLVVATLAANGATWSPGTGQKPRWNIVLASIFLTEAGSDKPATSSSVTMTYRTKSTSLTYWALVGVDLRPT